MIAQIFHPTDNFGKSRCYLSVTAPRHPSQSARWNRAKSKATVCQISVIYLFVQNQDVPLRHPPNYARKPRNTDGERRCPGACRPRPLPLSALRLPSGCCQERGPRRPPLALTRRGRAEPPRPPPCLRRAGAGGPSATPSHKREPPPAGVNH